MAMMPSREHVTKLSNDELHTENHTRNPSTLDLEAGDRLQDLLQ